ncbi:MAG: ATP-dependent DNA helicase RecG, partial [Bacteroidetes bacterium]|nr:ATP-dependent DNA helicase RecG [Bacteroidota bacterium]MBU1719725.1 ATP-dependent DNA helicase RecG [Bacteroidota bacterium]
MEPGFLDTPIEFLKGVGPLRALALKNEADVHTFRDLLYYFPFRYVDKTRFYTISELEPEMPYVQIRGKIVAFELIGEKRARRLVAEFTDGQGSIELVWFQGIKWIKDKLKVDAEYVIFGKPGVFKGRYNISHPEIETIAEFQGGMQSAFQPVYSSTEFLKSKGLESRGIMKLVATLFQKITTEIPETIPAYIRSRMKLVSLSAALRNVHYPDNVENLKKARYRLKFEEFFFIQLDLMITRSIRMRLKNGMIFPKVGEKLHDFYNTRLPFELTEAQKRVVREIRKDLGSGSQMNRMVQGDVGSGKTLVALMSMLIAIDNGAQACLMAPTEVLANQHFNTFRKMLGDMKVTIALLTGSTKTSERKVIHETLANGELNILIGTHAILEDPVKFSNLGFVVIDEQHKFGVAQRATLHAKNTKPPHILIMTATPIPRTLAMTFYGDLDTSVIDEMPPGRKDIITIHRTDNERHKLHHFIREQIRQGRQIYVVYPLITESEKLDLKDLNLGYENLLSIFPRPEYQICCVHGRQKPKDKAEEMRRFVSGEAHIMVSTTV